jgi:small subunit ribosomal protein S8
MTDPVGDMITRIRNAGRAHHEKVEIPASKLRESVAQVLKDEGYIKDFIRHKDGIQGAITVMLKYGGDGEPVISMISRSSRPGLRRYVQVNEIPRIRNGMGISILSTSRGVMADRKARKMGVGGELLCVVA